MSDMKIVVIVAAVLLVVSKLCDVLSTVCCLTEEQESNRLARRWMKRWGFKCVCWTVFAAVALIAGLCVLESFLWQKLFVDIVLSVVMLFISVCQFSVAHYNVTHRHNAVTRIIARFYYNPAFWSRILRNKRR